MATVNNGIITTNAYQGTNGTRYLELVWEKTAFSMIDKTTTIKWTLTSKGTYTGYFMSGPFSVSIDGKQVYYSESRIKLYPKQEIASGTYVLNHNTDGTKAFTINVSAAIYYGSANVSGSGNFEINFDGQAVITKAPNFTDEENPTIEYFNPSGDTTTTLDVCISLTGANPDIEYRAVSYKSGSYTFNLTDAERKILRAATQGSNSRKVFFYIRKKVADGIYFSNKEVSFTVVNANPTVEASVIDTNAATVALTGDNKTLIRYHSTAAATMAATAYKEATIKTQRIEHNGGNYTGPQKVVDNVNGNTFAFIASDSRGNTARKTIVAPMIDYILPTANIDKEEKIDTNGNFTLRCSGNYYNDTFGFTAAATENTITVKYRYKTSGGNYGAWQELTPTLYENTYNAEIYLTGLDYQTTYTFQCQTEDELNIVVSAEYTVISMPVFHWSQTDFVFEVPVEFKAGTTGIEGGNNEEPQETIEVISGSWQPTLTTTAAVQSYETRQGWYSKVGNVVNIGWQIKATINFGYQGQQIIIDGCPYTPAYAAFGGGVAHNIFLSAGFCFEGWGIGTDGNITGRGQPCNGTAAGNLNITSGVNYPSSTSTAAITLAGSICFTV